MFSKFVVWLREIEFLWKWLFWWAWVVVFVCWAFPEHWIHRATEDRIKWCGMLFQLGALCNAWQAINESRADFGLMSLQQLFFAWLKRFKAIFLRPVNVVIHAEGGSFGVSATGSAGILVTRASLTFEQRLDNAEKQLAALEGRLTSEMARVVSEAKAMIERENAERIARVSEIGAQMRKGFVGGWRLAGYGALNLLIGTILTAIPEDLAKFLKLLRLAV